MKINVNSVEKINYELAKVQELAKVRTVRYEDILTAVKNVEERLGQLLYKKDWVNLSIWCDPNAKTFPHAYHGVPKSTQFTLKRFPSGWFITWIGRATCNGSHRYAISGFSRKGAELIEYASRPF